MYIGLWDLQQLYQLLECYNIGCFNIGRNFSSQFWIICFNTLQINHDDWMITFAHAIRIDELICLHVFFFLFLGGNIRMFLYSISWLVIGLCSFPSFLAKGTELDLISSIIHILHADTLDLIFCETTVACIYTGLNVPTSFIGCSSWDRTCQQPEAETWSSHRWQWSQP